MTHSSPPEIPEFSLVSGKVLVSLGPARPSAVSQPDVIARVCEDEAKAVVG